MNDPLKTCVAAAFLVSLSLAAGAQEAMRMPYLEAGLTERQAAAHLLDRFAYGPRPGDIDRVIAMGLEPWFEAQLAGQLPDSRLDEKLSHLPALQLSAAEMARQYPGAGQVLAMARREGLISESDSGRTRREMREQLSGLMMDKGMKPQRELIAQTLAQKIFRATYSENQLQEVMTDFWFNHFNVSTTDNQCRPYILSYERDAIRPHVFGPFVDLLFATARHPAMLLYLDNAQSTAAPESTTTLQYEAAKRRGRSMSNRFNNRRGEANMDDQRRRRRGINENYARELLELHTLGVDGGYTQSDVEAVARAFSGWTVLPAGARREQIMRRIDRGRGMGFVTQGEFLFQANAHDAGEKQILGFVFPAGGGIEEGEQILQLLAGHPETASHIAQKLATAFVSDDPPEGLVLRLKDAFLSSGGRSDSLLRTLVSSPEFWLPRFRGAKIKSPLQLAVSAVRAVNAEIRRPRPLVNWIAKMGQPLYAYQAPTGYPDRASAWVNTGSLLNRMNFGLSLAGRGIRGLRLDLAALNADREPESLEAALQTYGDLLLPERDLASSYRRLLPMATHPDLLNSLNTSAPNPASSISDSLNNNAEELDAEEDPGGSGDRQTSFRLAQVVGVILGSPEFQRR